MAASLRPRGRVVRRRQPPRALERHAGLKDPRCLSSLMYAYIGASSMAGVRPEEARASSWDEDIDLDGNTPSVAVLRTDRAGGDTKTPRSRRASSWRRRLRGRCSRGWQADQAAEREAAGSHWQDTGRAFTTATGTPLDARHIRKMFQGVCERAGFGRPVGIVAEIRSVRGIHWPSSPGSSSRRVLMPYPSVRPGIWATRSWVHWPAPWYGPGKGRSWSSHRTYFG